MVKFSCFSKGKTLPKITRCLTKKSDLLVESASLPQPPFKPSKSSSQHLLLPLSEHVPKECTSDAIVCLSLAGLHEKVSGFRSSLFFDVFAKGHLAEVYDLIRASNDGIASVSSTNKPSIEHALFYYQTAGFHFVFAEVCLNPEKSKLSEAMLKLK